MDYLINILIGYGYWGMLLSAFLAGSFFPFSSEVVMVALSAAGLNSWKLIVFGTIGNVLGGAFNYVIGRMGKMVWIEKYLHVSQKNLDKAEKFMGGHGALMGFFAFLPILGSAITIVLGLTRANIPLSLISVTLGKFLRYVILIYGANLLIA
ncbi:MAG: YqaA family protein [Prevotella sp.]